MFIKSSYYELFKSIQTLKTLWIQKLIKQKPGYKCKTKKFVLRTFRNAGHKGDLTKSRNKRITATEEYD